MPRDKALERNPTGGEPLMVAVVRRTRAVTERAVAYDETTAASSRGGTVRAALALEADDRRHDTLSPHSSDAARLGQCDEIATTRYRRSQQKTRRSAVFIHNVRPNERA